MIRNRTFFFALPIVGAVVIAALTADNDRQQQAAVKLVQKAAQKSTELETPAHSAASEQIAEADKLAELTKRALTGDAEAEFQLGVHYAEQVDNPFEPAPAAVYWLQHAADAGNAPAQNEIGYMYEWGRYGMEVNYAAARRWYRRAIEQNDPYALSNLGVIYRDGKGVPRSESVATRYFAEAAKFGLATAHFDLGIRMIEGLGTEKSRAKGLAQQKEAIRLGETLVGYLRTEIHYHNNYAIENAVVDYILAEKPPVEALPERIYGLAHRIRAVSKSDAPDPRLTLAHVMKVLWGRAADDVTEVRDGTLPATWRDPALADALIQTAATLGHKKAQSELAALYETNAFGQPNPSEAAYWRKRAEGLIH